MANSLTFRRDRETIVQFIPEPDSLSEGFIGTGRTTCHPKDMYDPFIGERIALGRAMVDLGKQLESNGMAAIISFDEGWISEQRARAQEYLNQMSGKPQETEGASIEDEPEQQEQPVDAEVPPPGIVKWATEHGWLLQKEQPNG